MAASSKYWGTCNQAASRTKLNNAYLAVVEVIMHPCESTKQGQLHPLYYSQKHGQLRYRLLRTVHSCHCHLLLKAHTSWDQVRAYTPSKMVTRTSLAGKHIPLRFSLKAAISSITPSLPTAFVVCGRHRRWGALPEWSCRSQCLH